jgi:hypothetical protein
MQVWIMVGAVAIALFLLLFMAVLLFLGKHRPAPSLEPAILDIIPARTNTPLPISDSAGSPIGSETAPAAQHGIGFATGAYVQVIGTGGDGLRLRDQPGLIGNVLLVANDAEVFRIEDGPVEMDNYTWWSLVGPFDEKRRGWGVDNYLELIQNP